MDKKAFEIQARVILEKSKEEIIQLKEPTKPIAPENAKNLFRKVDYY